MAPTLTYPPKPQRGDAVAVLSPSRGGPAAFPLPFELGLARLRDEFGLRPVEYTSPHGRRRDAPWRSGVLRMSGPGYRVSPGSRSPMMTGSWCFRNSWPGWCRDPVRPGGLHRHGRRPHRPSPRADRPAVVAAAGRDAVGQEREPRTFDRADDFVVGGCRFVGDPAVWPADDFLGTFGPAGSHYKIFVAVIFVARACWS
jgi:hypothetical protein